MYIAFYKTDRGAISVYRLSAKSVVHCRLKKKHFKSVMSRHA